MNHIRGFAAVTAILIGVGALLIFGVAIYFTKLQNISQPAHPIYTTPTEQKSTSSSVSEITEKMQDVKNWKNYHNQEYGFDLQYPSSFTVISNVSSEVGVAGFPSLNLKLGTSDDSEIITVAVGPAGSPTTTVDDYSTGEKVEIIDGEKVLLSNESDLTLVKNSLLFNISGESSSYSPRIVLMHMKFFATDKAERLLKNTDTIVSSAVSGAQKNDANNKRISNIGQIQLALENYRSANKFYPKKLDILVPKYYTGTLADPLDGKPYSYSQHGTGDGYHIGTSLIDAPSVVNLTNDKDCNSLTGIGCDFSSGYDSLTAFDGNDTKGCRGETGRHCYDTSLTSGAH